MIINITSLRQMLKQDVHVGYLQRDYHSGMIVAFTQNREHEYYKNGELINLIFFKDGIVECVESIRFIVERIPGLKNQSMRFEPTFRDDEQKLMFKLNYL